MKILKTLAGWAVIVLISWILLTPSMTNSYTGFGETIFLSLFTVVQLFVLSIVCTLGISLIIWIPLGYGVGWIVFKIAGWDKPSHKKPREGTQQPEPQSAAPLTRDQQALLNYIKKARTKGLNDDQISQNLTSNGWATDSIAAAFQMVRNG